MVRVERFKHPQIRINNLVFVRKNQVRSFSRETCELSNIASQVNSFASLSGLTGLSFEGAKNPPKHRRRRRRRHLLVSCICLPQS